MPFEPSRRSVSIGLGSVVLSPGLSLAGAQDLALAWRQACLATEQAWIDEAAAIEHIIAQGVEHPNDRYHEAALGYWRFAQAVGVERGETLSQRVEQRYPLRYPKFKQDLDRDLAETRRVVSLFETNQKRWKQFAAAEGMEEHTIRIAKAEDVEDAIAAAILAKPTGSDEDQRLHADVTSRVADIPALHDEKDRYELADVLGAEKPEAAVSGRLTAAIIVRRLEALGYSVQMGKTVTLYDWHSQPETDAMRRRAGRLIACARSIPDVAAEAKYFRSKLRFEEADWWMGPRPTWVIA